MLISKITIKTPAKDKFYLNEISAMEVRVNAVHFKIKTPKCGFLHWVSKMSLQFMELRSVQSVEFRKPFANQPGGVFTSMS